jgi:uncharacterized protein YkwD
MKSLNMNRIAGTAIISTVVFLCGCAGLLHTSPWDDAGSSAAAKGIMEPVNEARSRGRMCGSTYYRAAPPVIWNEKLGKAALDHSRDMAQNGFLSHSGSDRSDPGDRLSKAGYRWSFFGENIGQGYRSADEAVNAWLKSEMHCKNIMNPAFRETGSAYAMNNNLRKYWTLVFGKQKR